MKEFEHLKDLSRKIHILNSISHLLDWDHETYMPQEAYKFRGDQLALLASLSHKEKTGTPFKKALSALIDIESGSFKVKGLSFAQKKSLENWRRDFLQEIRLPAPFIKKWAKVTSESSTIWAQARKENNFSLFMPYLETIVSLCQEKVSYLGFKNHPYDALLDKYDPGRTTQQVDLLFAELGKSIPPFLKKILEQQVPEGSFLTGDFSHEKLLTFCEELLKKIGFDFEKGRLDLSSHPFSSTIHPLDSRITTRIFSHSYIETISATIHEAGHSFYEMGMNLEEFGTPLSQAVSMSIHESQSRFWETCLGQSKPFWNYFLPILKSYIGPILDGVDLHTFYGAINRVSKNPIRVDADEVSYPLHVIVRYELEKGLIAGHLKVKDVPESWNFLMKKFLDIVPKNDSEGCLQDIHWSMGGFGYFPTYTLGNLYAACFFHSFEKKFPDWSEKVSEGNFSFIKNFLSEHIYQWGRQYTGDELLKNLSGEKLTPKSYLTYLKTKYTKLYL